MAAVPTITVTPPPPHSERGLFVVSCEDCGEVSRHYFSDEAWQAFDEHGREHRG